MSRLTIDTGTAGNPATGDSLRGAFTKVNTNFAELYAELGGDSLDTLIFTNNTISSGITNGTLVLEGNGTGAVDIEGIQVNDNQIITTTSNANLLLDGNGTGTVVINGLSFPTADGTAGQVLKTDGAGNLSFTAVDPGAITFVGDDSTGTAVNIGETFKIAGGTGLASTVSGDTITLDIDATVATLTGTQELTNKTLTFGSNTISGTAAQFNNSVVDADFVTLDGFEILTNKTINTANNTITGTVITMVGDDSTGATLNIAETFKIAGAQNITTAVSGDTLTITGPNLTGYAQKTDTAITLVGDDSTGTAVTIGETIKIAGAGTVTTAVSGDTLTITGTAGGGGSITFVGDDSTGTAVSTGETIKIAGAQNITTAVSGDTLTITGSKNIDVNSISSGDSTAVQVNDGLNVSGSIAASSIVVDNLLTGIKTSTIVSGVLTLDFTFGTHIVNHNANITSITFTNASAVKSSQVTVILTQDATGGRTITGSYATAGGLGLDISTTANAVNIVTFFTRDNSTFFGFSNGKSFS